MDSSKGSLTPFQRDTLRAFFERERGFFLTGGAALVGFHLHHRETHDLDLFTLEQPAFERGRRAMQDLARALGATLELRQDSPGFSRYALTRNGEVLIVDLVLEPVAQRRPEKLELDGIRVDPADEILANKLTALVGRLEERDLVDVLFLERTGLRVEDALASAEAKDGGCTPANLAWLLSQIEIPDGARLPAGVTTDELREFVSGLVGRLRKLAHPGSK